MIPLIIWGVVCNQISFDNTIGRVLSTCTLGVVLLAPNDLHYITKIGYFMTSLSPVLFPGNFVQSNLTHSIAALWLDLSVAVMVVGNMKKKYQISF